MSGIKCPPGTHKYEPYGKVLYCVGCADVQPLLLELATAPLALPPAQNGHTNGAPKDVTPEPPTPEDDEAAIAALRSISEALRGKSGAQVDDIEARIGKRRLIDDLSEDEIATLLEDDEVIERSNTRPHSRVRVGEGVEDVDDRLPDAGL